MALANLRRCFSPKERLGRKGFIIIFLCAIVSVEFFAETANYLWFYYHSHGFFQFNLELKIFMLLGWFCLITGFVPLAIIACAMCTYECFIVMNDEGFLFPFVALLVDLLYAFYIIQCIRRCRDLGRSWLFCLIPFYNPFVLLFGKSKQQGEQGVAL